MEKCPVCHLPATFGRPTGDRKQVVCPRCGHYEISGSLLGMIRNRVDGDRQTLARLSFAIRRRATGDNWPTLNTYNLDELCQEPLPKPKAQVLLFLRWLADQAGDDRFRSFEAIDDHVAGVIGAVDADGASTIMNKAEDRGLVEFTPDSHYALTVDGWELVDAALEEEEQEVALAGGRIFIGHGRSRVWRDLKDYLHDRLGLEWDEFNRESVAGISTSERLETMLGNAAFAFIVMTAEDQTAAGALNPRMNVVHEAGLFQGKLGFRKAIVLLEEGCEEFSNIVGLGQIRFPVGNIDAVRDEIRQVLEREGLVHA
jgi:hypothetical protein